MVVWWGKSPCGSALGRTELRKYIFYVSNTQKFRFSIYYNYKVGLCGKKAPAGAHLVAPSLDNTDSVYVIHGNLCLKHRRCMFLQQILLQSQPISQMTYISPFAPQTAAKSYNQSYYKSCVSPCRMCSHCACALGFNDVTRSLL